MLLHYMFKIHKREEKKAIYWEKIVTSKKKAVTTLKFVVTACMLIWVVKIITVPMFEWQFYNSCNFSIFSFQLAFITMFF